MSTAIRDARRRSGISQADLARRLGVTRAAVQQYERSEALEVISLGTLRRALGAMGGGLTINVGAADDSPQRLFLDTASRLAEAAAAARARRGLSVADVAARADVDATLVRAVEGGEGVTNMAGVVRVLRSLDIKPLALPSS